MNNISSKKATFKILKLNSEIIVPVLTEYYNQNIKNSTFPNELKNAGMSPVYKKKNRYDQPN